MPVINPILVGFDWSQAFDVPSGTLQNGDTVRAEFRYAVTYEQPVDNVHIGAGVAISGNRITLSLTEAQSRPMKARPVLTSIVIVRGLQEIAIGQIITIPVILLPTRSVV